MKKRPANMWLEWSIRLFIALSLFVFGLFRHLYGTDEAAGSLLESGWANSSQLALLEVHLVTIFELILVVIALFAKFSKWTFVAFLTIGLIYVGSYLSAWFNQSYLFADLSRINGWIGLPTVLALVLFSFVSFKLFEGFERRGSVWLMLVLPIFLIGGYSVFYATYETEFEDLGEQYEVKYANWDWYWEAVDTQFPALENEQEYTLCFFSTTCSHCNEAAKRIGVYQRRFNKKIYGVFFSRAADQEFWENDKIIEEFMHRNHFEADYLKMLDYEAVSIADNQFPVVLTMKGGKPVRKYVGDDLNAWAFDHLFK